MSCRGAFYFCGTDLYRAIFQVFYLLSSGYALLMGESYEFGSRSLTGSRLSLGLWAHTPEVGKTLFPLWEVFL